MHLDMDELRALQADDLVNLIQDPYSDLLIANYAPKAQYANAWDAHPVLLDCRGTIIRPDGTVYAKPFRKFFNAGERPGTSLEELAALGEPEISHKRDGSMITLFRDPGTGRVRCATRGSFASEQAIAAERLWYATYGDFVPADLASATYVFEYTGPENRIVVSYDRTELTMIGLVNIVNGHEFSYGMVELIARANGMPCVALESDITVLSQERDNFEGYVLYWPAQKVRVKVKLAEYVRLHKIITGVSERTVWEYLRDGAPLEPLVDKVPDEFHRWLNATVQKLCSLYAERERIARALYEQVLPLPTRKDQALALQNQLERAVVFKMLDGRDYADLICRELRPTATRPFKEDDAA